MTDLAAYRRFLEAKVVAPVEYGAPVDAGAVHPICKPHQAAIIRWAVQGGRRAIFAKFGLGKTVMQLEVLRLTLATHPGRALIIAPLGVRQEFMRDAAMLGTALRFVRTTAEMDADGIYLTNYESVRDGKIDVRGLTAVSLDEASVLRGFGGTKTFRAFMATLAGDDRTTGVRTAGVPYRFVATATPSPNEYLELASYAAFLGVMDVGEVKTRFFKRDSAHADKLTLYAHKEEEFWLWVNTWAVFLQSPADLGFPADGYELPPLTVTWHTVSADHAHHAGYERDGQAKLLRDAAIGVQDAAAVKRETIGARIERLLEIIHTSYARDEDAQSALLREAPRGGEEADPRALPPGEASGVRGAPRQAARLPAGVSQSESAGPHGSAASQEESGAARAVRERSDVSGEDEAGEPRGGTALSGTQATRPAEAGLRHQRGGVRRASRGSGRSLRDLPGAAADRSVQEPGEAPACGPLPRDEEGARTPLQQLQFRDRPLQGRSGPAAPSDRVSDRRQWIVWCDLNDEQDAIERALLAAGISCSSLRGSQSIEEREVLLDRWRNRETTVFLSKPSMYGAGVNLQQCHQMVFVGVSFKAQDIIQGVHRIHRYQQANPCTVHFIFADAEIEVRRVLEAKWQRHELQMARMTDIIRQYGLNAAAARDRLVRTIGASRAEESGETWVAVNNDCIEETAAMSGDSVGLIVTSIPFGTQYEYSPSYNDFGHTDDDAHFFEQMDFLSPELLCVLKPGRVLAVHVKDRVRPGGLDGWSFQTISPFHAETMLHYRRHGFAYMGMITVVTDVVRENAQTYRLGWTEQCKDGSKMSVGLPEYVLLFRKPPTDSSDGYADERVVKQKSEYSRTRWQLDAHGFWRSNGNRLLASGDLVGVDASDAFKRWRAHSLSTEYEIEHHVAVGEAREAKGQLPPGFMLLPPHSWHPDVWTDVTRMRTLNGAQYAAGKEPHLCPLQFDIVDRLIHRFSNPGDVVYDPFGGLGTVALRAVELGRRGRTVELNTAYWADTIWYLRRADEKRDVPTLFDLVAEEPAA